MFMALTYFAKGCVGQELPKQWEEASDAAWNGVPQNKLMEKAQSMFFNVFETSKRKGDRLEANWRTMQITMFATIGVEGKSARRGMFPMKAVPTKYETVYLLFGQIYLDSDPVLFETLLKD